MRHLTVTAFRQPLSGPRIRALGIQVGVSPYVFPERLDCEYEPSTGSLIVHFRYIDNEPPGDVAPTPDPRIRIRMGRHTGRLLEMRVPVDLHGIEKVDVQISEKIAAAIDRLADTRHDERSEANLALAKRAVAENQDALRDLVIA